MSWSCLFINNVYIYNEHWLKWTQCPRLFLVRRREKGHRKSNWSASILHVTLKRTVFYVNIKNVFITKYYNKITVGYNKHCYTLFLFKPINASVPFLPLNYLPMKLKHHCVSCTLFFSVFKVYFKPQICVTAM